MEFYDEKDMKYWKKQCELGKALIIEIPVSMLIDLDIRSLSRDDTQPVTYDDLHSWLDKNKDIVLAELAREAAEKEEVEKLKESLYENVPRKNNANEQSRLEKLPVPKESEKEMITRIMSEEVFSDEQIKVIAEAMLEELPEKYLLCFLKKDYSPAVMRQLKEYVTKLYRDEMFGSPNK